MSKLNADKLSPVKTGKQLHKAMTMGATGTLQISMEDSGPVKQTYQLGDIEPIIEEEKGLLGNQDEQDFFGASLPPPN